MRERTAANSAPITQLRQKQLRLMQLNTLSCTCTYTRSHKSTVPGDRPRRVHARNSGTAIYRFVLSGFSKSSVD